MPLIPILLIGGGSLAGLKLWGDAADDTAQLAKWAAIGGVVYLAGKYTKAW